MEAIWTQPNLFDPPAPARVTRKTFHCMACGWFPDKADRDLHVKDVAFTKKYAPPFSGWVFHVAARIAYDNLVAALNLYTAGAITWDDLVAGYRAVHGKIPLQIIMRPIRDAGVNWGALDTAIRPNTNGCWYAGPRTIEITPGVTRYYCKCGKHYATKEATQRHIERS